ncbi:MAG: transposase [Kiritimatiellae bacterium]|nr:transposase [Kiritimatiellia bacterium]
MSSDQTTRRPPWVPSPEELRELAKEWGKPKPLYSPKALHVSHALRYDWTGWLSDGVFFPGHTLRVAGGLAPLWAKDGLQFIEAKQQADRLQILFRVQPQVSPVFFAGRVKGRLQHALRQAGTPVAFSRKLAVRTLGDNTRKAVEGYIRKQIVKEDFVDPRYVKRLQDYTVAQPDVDLAEPAARKRSRYWYNLHLVLVVWGRRTITDYKLLAALRDQCFAVARKKDYAIKSLSVMPDHLHAALRGNPDHSPEEIALGFLNNLAFAAGRERVWQDHYYVGTFSEYDVNVILKPV